MSKEAEVNYTEAMVARIEAVAEANEGVITNDEALELAEEFGKDVRSVRAKAVRMGLYQKAEKQSTNGGKIETKEDIATEIAKLVGQSVDGIEKGTKVALQRVRDALKAA